MNVLTNLTTGYNARISLEWKLNHLKTWRSTLRTAWSNTACNSGSHWLLHCISRVPIRIDPGITALLSLMTLFGLQSHNIIACNIHCRHCSLLSKTNKLLP